MHHLAHHVNVSGQLPSHAISILPSRRLLACDLQPACTCTVTARTWPCSRHLTAACSKTCPCLAPPCMTGSMPSSTPVADAASHMPCPHATSQQQQHSRWHSDMHNNMQCSVSKWHAHPHVSCSIAKEHTRQHAMPGQRKAACRRACTVACKTAYVVAKSTCVGSQDQPCSLFAGICLFSDCNMEGISSEAHLDLEEYVQLLEDVNQRCNVLQHDLRGHNDAIVHR